jgi:hypothetical protein
MIGAGQALAAPLAIALAMQPGASDRETGDPVYTACRDAGGDATACGCVSREARSRFNADQLTIIAAAIPDVRKVGQPQELVDTLGLSLDQILNLRQRAINADRVINAACGIGFDTEPER